MFTGKQPEHVQDLVSDFNEDLKVLTKKNDLQITKGVYLGDLFVQAENFQIAKNWLTKTYWQSLLDSMAGRLLRGEGTAFRGVNPISAPQLR